MHATFGRSAIAAAMLLVGAGSANAQSTGSGAFAGFGLGYGTAGMYAGGRSDLKPGQLVLARVGLRRGDRPLLAVDAEYQAYKAPMPGQRAEFRALTVLAGVHLFPGNEFYIIPALGWQFRTWSGEERVVDSDDGPLASLGFGYHLSFGDRFALAPEVVGRIGDAKDAGAGSFRAVGFRVIATWKL